MLTPHGCSFRVFCVHVVLSPGIPHLLPLTQAVLLNAFSKMPNTNPGSQFQDVWIAALTKYKQDAEHNYFEHWLVEDSPDTLFRLLDGHLENHPLVLSSN